MADDAEIRRLDALIDKATDETLDSTRRMLGTATETQQIGVDTLITLNEQGELGAGRGEECVAGSEHVYIIHTHFLMLKAHEKLQLAKSTSIK